MPASKRFVYILKSERHARYYTGVTSDVFARLATHNGGGCVHTATGCPWNIDVIVEFADERRGFLSLRRDVGDISCKAVLALCCEPWCSSRKRDFLQSHRYRRPVECAFREIGPRTHRDSSLRNRAAEARVGPRAAA